MEVNKDKVEVPRSAQDFEDLALLTRNIIGALKKLEKAKQPGVVGYWTNAVNHWIKATEKHLGNQSEFAPSLTRQLYEELLTNIDRLHRVPGLSSGTAVAIPDDLEYRLRTLFDSTIDFVGVQTIIVHANLSNYKQNVDALKKKYEHLAGVAAENHNLEDGELIAAFIEDLKKIA